MTERLNRQKSVRYEVVKPRESLDASLLWVLGEDDFSRRIAERLGYFPDGQCLDFIIKACDRDLEALKKIKYVMGRTATFESPVTILLNIPYDTIEIGGFGFRKFSRITNSNICLSLDYPSRILIPSPENFAQNFPEIVQTEVVEGDKIITIKI